jgi:thiol-disulfide isomerase/thioredoxin
MNASLKTLLTTLKKPRVILFIAGVAILGAVAYWAYTKYVKPQFRPAYVENNEYEQKEAVSGVTLYFFHTEWCPHCQTARPHWNRFKDAYSAKKVNGKTITFREVDCDADEETAARFEVDGYPTVKLVRGSQIIELDGKPTFEVLEKFVQATV